MAWRAGTEEIQDDITPTKDEWSAYLDYLERCGSENPRVIPMEFIDWFKSRNAEVRP